jgi:Mrp family chromosome partitioning ATPase
MKSLLNDLAAHATVIIDAPPLLPVTDGAVLTHQADGALLVVSLGKTTYDLVDKALGTLAKARGRALGIVLNKVPMKGVDSSPYSYEYRREYGDASKLDRADDVAADAAGFDLNGVFSVDASDDEAGADPRRVRARRG